MERRQEQSHSKSEETASSNLLDVQADKGSSSSEAENREKERPAAKQEQVPKKIDLQVAKKAEELHDKGKSGEKEKSDEVTDKEVRDGDKDEDKHNDMEQKNEKEELPTRKAKKRQAGKEGDSEDRSKEETDDREKLTRDKERKQKQEKDNAQRRNTEHVTQALPGGLGRTGIFGQPVEETFSDITPEEADILDALSEFWLQNIGRFTPKQPVVLSEKERLFYETYCNGTDSLKTEVKNRLLRLPHVVAVFLKRTAQIEVVVTNCEEALQASPELREDHFDVVAVVGMHFT